jgi:fluoride exporter
MIWVALGGGVGALLRFLLDGWVNARARAAAPGLGAPVGTVVINVTGSLLLGLVTGWWMLHSGGEEWKLILGTGILGGYTTFSTASVEAARLVLNGRGVAAGVHSLGMLVASVAAAGAGVWLISL